MEESFESATTENERAPSVSNRMDDTTMADSLIGMSKDEMTQHLKLCMKLAAENKINVKNAFGLHLIGIMRHLIKHESPDLQFASLSLQASTKIYAGRVEALYKDTFQFHSHLQTIMAHGRKAPAESQSNDPDNDDSSDEGPGRKSHKTKCKSYLASEDSIDIQSPADRKALLKPHGNFVAIKSAFCASRTTKKLLQTLHVESDLCNLNCGTSSRCHRNKMETNPAVINFPQKMTGFFEKLKNVNISAELTTIGSASDVFSLRRNTPPRTTNSGGLPDFSFAPCNDPDSPIGSENGVAVNSIIDRFSVMDITATDFANDIAHAVTGGNTINRMLLPPKSALKKVLRERKSFLGASPPKTAKKEKKPKGPFFNGERTLEKRMFITGGRKNDLSDTAISDWSVSEVTDICSGHNVFSTILGHQYEEDKEAAKKKETAAFKVVTDLTQESEDQFSLRHYFHKKPQVWQKFKQKSQETVLRPSSFGLPLRNGERTGSLFAGDAANLVQSLQNLSLHNSFDYDDGRGDQPGDPFSPNQDADPFQPSRPGSFLEDDIQLMMVQPPELVKPLNVRYSKQPMTINTEKFKDTLWNILETNLKENDAIFLTDVYKELQERFKNDKSTGISLQMTFVMLLILANEKILLLENISDSSNLCIKRDISEINSSEVF